MENGDSSYPTHSLSPSLVYFISCSPHALPMGPQGEGEGEGVSRSKVRLRGRRVTNFEKWVGEGG